MTAAREKVESVLRHLQQREEKQRQARAAWDRSKSRCLAIAQALLDGTNAGVSLHGDELILMAKSGAKAVFAFDLQQLAMVGTRFKSSSDAGEPFFSLKIEPPARSQSVAPGQWGPGKPEGIGELSGRMDSQAAFEKAVADWFEWAHIGDGAPPA